MRRHIPQSPLYNRLFDGLPLIPCLQRNQQLNNLVPLSMSDVVHKHIPNHDVIVKQEVKEHA
jgi:hypothetical protein